MTDIPALPPSGSNDRDQDLWISTLPLTILLWVAMIGSLSFLILCCRKQKRSHVITDEERAQNGHHTIEEIDKILREFEEIKGKTPSPTRTQPSSSHNSYNLLENQKANNLGTNDHSKPIPQPESTTPRPSPTPNLLPNAHSSIISIITKHSS